MSALESEGVLKPILLRSSTPAPNEKVLQYLQSMTASDEPDDAPPRSLVDPDEYLSVTPSRNGIRSPQPQQMFSPAMRSKISENYNDLTKTNGNDDVPHDGIDHEDADSNIQVGERSEVGDDIPLREPGPNDPPGPKYESYDSGPSFGNFGPLPTEDRASHNPYANNSWAPDWTQIRGTENGAPSVNAGQAPPTAIGEGSGVNGTATPRAPSRAPTRLQSQLAGSERPFSPAARSRVAGTEKGTAYPPLPESAFGGDHWDAPLSPKSRAWSKAPSISPSDSPSQMKPKPVAKSLSNGYGMSRSPPPGSPSPFSPTGHQSRPFSPYRHAPTTEDLIHAAVRGRALVIPEEEEEKTASVVKQPSLPPLPSSPPQQVPLSPPRAQSPQMPQMASPRSKLPSQLNGAPKTASQVSKTPSTNVSRQSARSPPVQERAPSRRTQAPEDLDLEQARIVNEALLGVQTPRTSYYAASIEPGLTGHFHDGELCELLRHESDAGQPDVIRKALRKAIRQRVKKLGMNYDTEAIKQYKRSYRGHDHEGSQGPEYDDEPPRWASDIKRELVLMQQRIESLGPKIENLRFDQSFEQPPESRFLYEPNDDLTHTPQTQTVNIDTHAEGTLADSMYRSPDDDEHVREFDDMTETNNRRGPQTEGETVTRTPQQSAYGASDAGRDDSPGQQLLEEELYKLKQRPHGSQSGVSHRTWEIARNDEDHDYDEEDDERRGAPSGLPTIPDTNADAYPEREGSPPLPALPDHDEDEDNKQMEVHAQGSWNQMDYSSDSQTQQLPPWLRIHSRLLSWAIIWPMSELEQALNSTTRGHQVDEVALSIWSTQTYKRYVRARLTEQPRQGTADRLFVPPNMADAISNAVFNGRHGEACGMLRDLWTPFGLEGTPRLIVVLAKHRSDPSHWVVHRFSLPDATLTTYDSYPERTLPDGRPLGWWFAIRIAWPSAMFPQPDNLVQKMVRLHRPLQLPIDNSVAAAGIWRNILMGSKAERSLDLERLRDLINTEVKNLKQRKQLGKLSVNVSRQAWPDMR